MCRQSPSICAFAARVRAVDPRHSYFSLASATLLSQAVSSQRLAWADEEMEAGLSNHSEPNGPRGNQTSTRDRGIDFPVDSSLSGKLVASAEHAVTPSGALSLSGDPVDGQVESVESVEAEDVSLLSWICC